MTGKLEPSFQLQPRENQEWVKRRQEEYLLSHHHRWYHQEEGFRRDHSGHRTQPLPYYYGTVHTAPPLSDLMPSRSHRPPPLLQRGAAIDGEEVEGARTAAATTVLRESTTYSDSLSHAMRNSSHPHEDHNSDDRASSESHLTSCSSTEPLVPPSRSHHPPYYRYAPYPDEKAATTAFVQTVPSSRHPPLEHPSPPGTVPPPVVTRRSVIPSSNAGIPPPLPAALENPGGSMSSATRATSYLHHHTAVQHNTYTSTGGRYSSMAGVPAGSYPHQQPQYGIPSNSHALMQYYETMRVALQHATTTTKKNKREPPLLSSSKSSSSLEPTLEEDEASVVLTCNDHGCNFITYSMAELHRHKRSVHMNRLKPFECDHPGCTYASNHKGNLKSHQRKHRSEKPYQCTVEGCSYAAKWKSVLKRHLETHK